MDDVAELEYDDFSEVKYRVSEVGYRVSEVKYRVSEVKTEF